MWVMLSLGERVGVRASLHLSKMKMKKRTEFLARPQPDPLPRGEGIACGCLPANSFHPAPSPSRGTSSHERGRIAK